MNYAGAKALYWGAKAYFSISYELERERERERERESVHKLALLRVYCFESSRTVLFAVSLLVIF